jgi:hypothetical protein
MSVGLGGSGRKTRSSRVHHEIAAIPAASSAEEISDHFAELAAALDNDPFAIHAELA